MRAFAGMLGCGALLLTSGCADFFPKTTTSSTTVATTGDYVYVANQSADTLSEYSVGSGGLTAISGSPVALVTGLLPASVAVTRANTYVYVGGTGTIVAYSIGTGGALTAVTGGGISLVNVTFVAMDTSPDGQWLLAVDATSDTIRSFSINATTGVLTVGTAITIAGLSSAPSGSQVPKAMRIAPNGDVIAVALGSGGLVTFTFNTSTGVITQTSTGYYNANYTLNGVAFDSTSAYLWVAEAGITTGSSVIGTFAISGSTGAATLTGTPQPSGDSPYGLLVDSTNTYVYSANRNSSGSTGSISGYTDSSGALTPLASSPYASGLLATALAEDNTHAYVIAASFGGSSDVTLYKLDVITGGKLDAVATATDGTSSQAVAIAATH